MTPTVYQRVSLHQVVGIDHHGKTCACGAVAPSWDEWREHLGAVALAALDAPVARYRPGSVHPLTALEKERELEERRRLIHPDHYRTRKLLEQLAAELVDDERHIRTLAIEDPEIRHAVRLQIRLERIHRLEAA